jgi:nicotinamidase-related amidase
MSASVGGDASSTAVLVIDMQNETLHPDGALAGDFPAGAGGLLVAVQRLLEWARRRGAHVVWLRLAFRHGHVDAASNSMSRRLGTFLDGGWGAEILSSLGPEATDIVVTKRRPSGFHATDLDLVLRALGVTRILVAGVSTHWAVESTVRDAHSYGYEVVVVREAVADPFPEFHEPSLRAMASVFATVAGIDGLIAT